MKVKRCLMSCGSITLDLNIENYVFFAPLDRIKTKGGKNPTFPS